MLADLQNVLKKFNAPASPMRGAAEDGVPCEVESALIGGAVSARRFRMRKLGLVASLAVLVPAVASGCAASRTAETQLHPYVSVERTVTPPAPVPQPTATPEPAPPPAPVPAPEPPAAPTNNTKRAWWYTPNTTHRVPRVASGAVRLLSAYGGRYTGPNPELVYLTFDQGYENGNTSAILDALSRNGVKATFFVTESYVRNNPALVRRMVKNGHVVGNHSSTHPSMPSLSGDRTAFAAQFTKTAAAFTRVTGKRMSKMFRPPLGEYSPLSLWITQSLGYESVFWSFAHRDWVVDDQPSVSVTVRRILAGSHPGAIYLLHGVSSSDTKALDTAIAGLREQGYGFGILGR